MNDSDRRRSVLRRLDDLHRRWIRECEEAALHLGGERNVRVRALMRLADEAMNMRDEILLASLPTYDVVYLDDEAHEVSLEFGRITLVVPNDTPDSVVEALFQIAESMPPAEGPMRWTMDGLASAVVDSRGRVDDEIVSIRRRAEGCAGMSERATEGADIDRLEGKAAAYKHAAELVEAAR